LFYVQMKWNYQGRLSQDQLWSLEAEEGVHALAGVKAGMVKSIYKVAAQHRVIAIVDVESAEDMDRNTMGALPMREYLEFEHIWALRDYEGFIEDVNRKYRPTTPEQTSTTTARENGEPLPARPDGPW
jgi:muconolactone delta-isomerase